MPIGGFLHCTIVTPERLALEVETFDLMLPAHDGYIGIMPGHAPLICKLGEGIMRYHQVAALRSSQLFLDGGLFHVLDENVTIMTKRIYRREEMTFKDVEEILAEAEGMPTGTLEQVDERMKALNRARMMLKMVRGRGDGEKD